MCILTTHIVFNYTRNSKVLKNPITLITSVYTYYLPALDKTFFHTTDTLDNVSRTAALKVSDCTYSTYGTELFIPFEHNVHNAGNAVHLTDFLWHLVCIYCICTVGRSSAGDVSSTLGIYLSSKVSWGILYP